MEAYEGTARKGAERPRGDLKYLKLLAKQYPTVDDAATEIINLQAILNLPKGTEHFLTDIHGEYKPFQHILKNASGVIKGEIERIFGESLSKADKKELATLIYYPEQKLDLIRRREKTLDDWYKVTLYRLVEVCGSFSSKYTRSKVRKAMPKNFTYILEELLNTDGHMADKSGYYREIIKTIVAIGRAREFIVAISELIQRLAIDRLHIIGDIFDRGPGADRIIETLADYHAVDIQWGNHDMVWMGAASGSEACIAAAVRICTRYGNLDILEEAYGINLLPLATFAMEFYGDSDCSRFLPKNTHCESKEARLTAQMHKAITVIGLKLESSIIIRHPEFKMDDRLLLDKIDFEDGSIELGGRKYALSDREFPTVDRDDPFALSTEEKELVEKLRVSFVNSPKLQKHVRFLFSKGNLYLVFNNNLLFHGCIPMDDDGNFLSVEFGGEILSGRRYLDYLEMAVRKGFYGVGGERENGLDLMWYLWCGANSPLFGKDKMATFESYFIDDPACLDERKNPYYRFREDEDFCRRILAEFGLPDDGSHIINGHVPVEKKNGENPIKANGRLISIDGGFSKAYQNVTGIAGYTLIFDSYGLTLVSHEPFTSTEAVVEEETDIRSSVEVLERAGKRITVKDTDVGAVLKGQIDELMELLSAYQKGYIKEQIAAAPGTF